MEEMKDCPFCGGKASLFRSDNGTVGDSIIDPRFWVKCLNCKVEQHDLCVAEEAIKRWNQRA